MTLELFRAVEAARALLNEGHPLARASTVAAAEFGASPEEVARLADEAHRACTAAILAGADPRLMQFKAWAARAANLAGVATFEQVAAFAGAAAPAPNARQAREVIRLADEATARADQMRREAIAADAVALELDAMAAGILQALDRLGGSAAARLPRDWRSPLI